MLNKIDELNSMNQRQLAMCRDTMAQSSLLICLFLFILWLFCTVDACLLPAQTPQTQPQATNTSRDGQTPRIREDYYPTEETAVKRRERKQKQEKRVGLHVRLKANPFKQLLPAVLGTNV